MLTVFVSMDGKQKPAAARGRHNQTPKTWEIKKMRTVATHLKRWQRISSLGRGRLLFMVDGSLERWIATLTEPVDTSYRRGGDQIREMNFGEYNMLLAAENRVFLRSTGGTCMTTMPKHSNMEWVHWRKLDDNNAQTFKPSCSRKYRDERDMGEGAEVKDEFMRIAYSGHLLICQNFETKIHTVLSSSSSSARLSHKISGTSLWIPLDIVLEDAMDREKNPMRFARRCTRAVRRRSEEGDAAPESGAVAGVVAGFSGEFQQSPPKCPFFTCASEGIKGKVQNDFPVFPHSKEPSKLAQKGVFGVSIHDVICLKRYHKAFEEVGRIEVFIL
ncbi:hypothetical protein LXL04_003108 [Taraxacum kok-saghyz]